jgi:hypothetical protein
MMSSSFGPSHEGSGLRHLTIELGSTKVKPWILFLKSLKQ